MKDPNNPFYDKEKAEKEAFSLFADPNAVPFGILCYLIDNNMLPDAQLNSLMGKEHGRKLLADNQDFIIRYFRREIRE